MSTHCDEVCRIIFSHAHELLSGSILFLIHNLTFHSFRVGAAVDLERSRACSRDHLSNSGSSKAPTSSTQTCQYNINNQIRWAMILQKSHELSAKTASRPRSTMPIPPFMPPMHARTQLTISPVPNVPSSSRRTQGTSRHFKCPFCFLAKPSQACLNDHMRKAHAVLI